MNTSLFENKKIAALITLLEDEDNCISTTAMKELLEIGGKDLASILKEFQESDNNRLRKRIHQIQSIIRIRANRNRLASRLTHENSGLLQGLREIHLLWYDRDNEEALTKQVESFISKAKISKIRNINDIAMFMKKKDFSTTKNNELEPDAYCIGAVLDNKIGTDIILCALMLLITEDHTMEYKIIIKNNKFLFLGNNNYYIDPFTWEVERLDNISIIKNLEIFSTGRILRFIIYQLLLCSMCSASYRYVYTIGKSIGKSLNIKYPSGIFEKPYNGKIK